MLHREGVIPKIPSTLCGNKAGKNVILVIGDGMGWEMVRSGAIAKRVLKELEDDFGCDIKAGCPDNQAAIDAFAKRSLSDYYTEGTNKCIWQYDRNNNKGRYLSRLGFTWISPF